VLETNHPPTTYIPPPDVRLSVLTVSDAGPTWCEFKGEAQHLDAIVAGKRARGRLELPAPTAGYEALRDHVAFYPVRLDTACLITNEYKRSRATSMEDGSPATWSALSRGRLAPAAGSHSARAELAAFDDRISGRHRVADDSW
jgi:Domain of unknown function (DUF427)